ncbi:uncharacterized protein HMPREF1541_00451 [Cyphellophora europaea CBS 101466]|uniref:Uncharacterized protein n=1 Tax=Cyphellophora europaea (strain CBS 101466) TaxID=1220924 RepID=W2SC32_CYPE1|nr:uncharacterized protein HMPREF1541_00451 [Cyphellophora europaea CBS 101466]ETN46267.1 hypothetical protein HMPREF1541_00451 [Cyphellophora europaea CBS 101466]
MKQFCILDNVVNEINSLSQYGLYALVADDKLRRAALDATRRLTLLVQTPEEGIRSLAFAPTYNACVRIAIDLNLFRVLVSSPDTTATGLAKTVGAQPGLIVRLMRVLCGIGFARETGKFRYGPTSVTKHMCIPSTTASIIHLSAYRSSFRSLTESSSFDQGFPSISSLPQYFQINGYSSPDDYLAGPFQYGHSTDMETYSYWLTQPDVIDNFNVFMQGGKLKKTRRWTDWMPTSEVIVEGFSPGDGSVMLVDVAGGRGHDIEAFRSKHADSEGRLVLEDLPETIDCANQLHPRIERQAYNFFLPQPVLGGRAYFMQDIFHNWPTSVARLILKNTTTAMLPGYSKLLISETVLPDQNCPLTMAGLDWGMMYLHSGLERSEQQWRDLLAAEGLKVVCVHREEDGDSSIIEAMLDEARPG